MHVQTQGVGVQQQGSEVPSQPRWSILSLVMIQFLPFSKSPFVKRQSPKLFVLFMPDPCMSDMPLTTIYESGALYMSCLISTATHKCAGYNCYYHLQMRK